MEKIKPTQKIASGSRWQNDSDWGDPQWVTCKLCRTRHAMRTGRWPSGSRFVPTICNQCAVKSEIARNFPGPDQEKLFTELAEYEEHDGGQSPWYPSNWQKTFDRYKKWKTFKTLVSSAK